MLHRIQFYSVWHLSSVAPVAWLILKILSRIGKIQNSVQRNRNKQLHSQNTKAQETRQPSSFAPELFSVWYPVWVLFNAVLVIVSEHFLCHWKFSSSYYAWSSTYMQLVIYTAKIKKKFTLMNICTNTWKM